MRLRFQKIQLSKEILSIELLRGIASAMVCYFHLSRGNPRFLPPTSIVQQTGRYGWTGVEIFFVISGFVIPYAMFRKNYTIANFFTFLKKRIIRIEPPYLLSIVIVIALNYASTLSPVYRGAPFSINFANLAGHLAYLNAFTGATWLNPVYWSLAIEFQYYILIALSFGLIASDKLLYRLLFFVCFGASSFFVFPEASYIFSYAGFFLCGILLFQLVCGIIGSKEFWILLALTMGMLFHTQGPMLMCIAAASMLVITYVNKVPAVFRWLGMISYSLYLVHVPVGGRIINISEVLVHNVVLRECMVFVAFFVCIGASALFYRFIERTFKRMSGKIGYKHAEPVILQKSIV